MYRTHGLYVPTHRPLPVSPLDSAPRHAERDRLVPGVTEPFMFTRLFLVTGILLAAAAIAVIFSA